MKKMNNRKGFTLAELLIVVAIIAVLVAIAIPVFTSQLERAREATDVANCRSAYAAVMSQYLQTGNAVNNITVKAAQKDSGWVVNNKISATIGSFAKEITLPNKSEGQSWIFSCDSKGIISIDGQPVN